MFRQVLQRLLIDKDATPKGSLKGLKQLAPVFVLGGFNDTKPFAGCDF